jgi:predicted phage tail protein
MLRDVYLYGEAGRRYGRHFRISVDTPHEAIRALCVLRPGLEPVIRRGQWRLIVGNPRIRNSVDAMFMALGSQPLHIVPATRPAGGDGIGKAIAGVVMVGATILTAGAAAPLGAGFLASMAAPAFLGMSYGSLALMGASVALGGLATMLSPKPQQQQATSTQSTDMARVEDRPSFLFNGVVNNTQQGGPVPLVFGRHMVGSVVISGSLNAEDIAA